ARLRDGFDDLSDVSDEAGIWHGDRSRFPVAVAFVGVRAERQMGLDLFVHPRKRSDDVDRTARARALRQKREAVRSRRSRGFQALAYLLRRIEDGSANDVGHA